MGEGSKRKIKSRKVKVVPMQWGRLLEKDLMWIDDTLKQQEVEVHEANIKSFSSNVGGQVIRNLNV